MLLNSLDQFTTEVENGRRVYHQLRKEKLILEEGTRQAKELCPMRS